MFLIIIFQFVFCIFWNLFARLFVRVGSPIDIWSHFTIKRGGTIVFSGGQINRCQAKRNILSGLKSPIGYKVKWRVVGHWTFLIRLFSKCEVSILLRWKIFNHAFDWQICWTIPVCATAVRFVTSWQVWCVPIGRSFASLEPSRGAGSSPTDMMFLKKKIFLKVLSFTLAKFLIFQSPLRHLNFLSLDFFSHWIFLARQ